MAPISGYFDKTFAVSGDVTPVPDPVQGSGAVSYTEGFGVLYQTPVASGGLNIPRGSMNQLFSDITTAIQLQQQGLPAPFITSAMNNGSPFSYAEYATVILTGVAYTSNVGSNTTTPPSSSWTQVTLGNGLPLNAITGTGHNFVAGDASTFIERSNSGTNMVDTLPGTSGALANGWFAYVKNTDSAATDTITVGGGGTINQGNLTGNIIVFPGEEWFIQSQGSGVYNAFRIASALLHAAPVQGNAKNIKGAWVSTTTATYTADALVLQDANGNTRRISGFNKTVNSTVTGAGGLSIGSIAASTWYFIWAIYNPTTTAQNIIMDVSQSSSTLPSGYTYSALIGCVLTDGSNNFVGFTQRGNKWQYTVGSNLASLPAIASGVQGNVNTPTWVAAAWAGFAPSIVENIKFSALYENSLITIFAPNNSYAGVGTSNLPPLMAAGSAGQLTNIVADLVPESANFYYAGNGASSAVYVIGFAINI